MEKHLCKIWDPKGGQMNLLNKMLSSLIEGIMWATGVVIVVKIFM